jgi:hypothetical protein
MARSYAQRALAGIVATTPSLSVTATVNEA